jgi:chromosome segregation ATPase
MAEVKKLTEQEFSRLNLLKQDAIEIASALGELNYQKTILELQIQELTAKIKEIRSKESEFFQELRDIYGTISINLNTGEFQ